DRLLVRDLRRVGHDGGPELALESLDDDRGVRLAHRPKDLFAGRRAFEPYGGLLLQHPCQGRAHLVEVALALGLDRHHQRRRRPMPLTALPTSTGARTDSLTPFRRHASSSASAISSPSRYFVSTSSSASAAASSSWSRRRDTSSAIPSGIAISSSADPFQRHA